MTLVSRAIPGLFGGISQQIPAMRHSTQCSEQRNFIATVTDGLRTRPGTRHIATLALTGTNGASVAGSYGSAYSHFISRPGGALYCAVLVNGSMMVYDAKTGAPQPIVFPNGTGYLGSADPSTGFSCVTVADYTFIVNSNVKPAMLGTLSPTNPVNVHYINVRNAVLKTDYWVTVDGMSTHVYPVDNELPTTRLASYIVGGLVGAPGTYESVTQYASLGAGYSVSVVPGTSIVKVVRLDGSPVSVTVSDGWSNKGLEVTSKGVSTFSDLPAAFEAGYTVTVYGTADQNKDPYYVKWEGGRWVETVKPGMKTTLDASTMPHQLYRGEDGVWVFEQAPSWAARKVGDDDTNPEPSFVGQTVRDIFFHRNRLGILAGDSVVLSRAGSYYNFWGSTATQVVDTDPVDLSASVDGVSFLTYAVPLNQDLVVWTDTTQQMVLVAGDVLTPDTARLAPSTAFAANPSTRPVALGNKAVFAEGSGSYAKLSLYRVSDDTVTNTADSITDHVPRLVPNTPRQLASSVSERALVVLPSGASNELLHFKYELDPVNGVMTQQAWSRFVFDTPSTMRFIGARWVENRLYLLTHYTATGDDQPWGRFALEVLDFQKTSTDPGLDYALRLDRRVQLAGGAYDAGNNTTTYTVPYWEPSGVELFSCAPGMEPYPLTVLSMSFNAGTSTVTVKGDWTGRLVVAGLRFSCAYTFTEACAVDQAGAPVLSAELKLSHYLLRFEDSARAVARVTASLRGAYEYQLGGRVLGLTGHGMGQLALSSGTVRVPVGFKARDAGVSIETNSVLPITVPYAEWVGDLTLKANR